MRVLTSIALLAGAALIVQPGISSATPSPEDPQANEVRAELAQVTATVGKKPTATEDGYIVPIVAVARVDSRGDQRVRLGARVTCWDQEGVSHSVLSLAPRGQSASKQKTRARPYRLLGFANSGLESKPRRCVFGFGLWNHRNQQVLSLPAYCFRPGQSRVPRCTPARTRVAAAPIRRSQ